MGSIDKKVNGFITDFNRDKMQAIDFLFTRHYRNLCYIADQILNDQTQASDVVAEIFATICTHLETFDNLQAVELYLYNETKKACTGILAAGKQEHGILPVELEDEWMYEKRIEAQVLQSIFREMENLPPVRRTIFKLLFVEGLTSDEAAEKLNLSRQTILNQKTRALHTLRATFSKKRKKFYY
jgi:RNA polymerase sigma factor (sigma-70 family)